MSFWRSKKVKSPEPAEEATEEMAESRPTEIKRTITGETTQILSIIFDRLDKDIEDKKSIKQTAKKLQEFSATVGARLRKA